MVQSSESKIVHLDPDGALPVVLTLTELRMGFGETAEAIRRPKVLRIMQEIKDCA